MNKSDFYNLFLYIASLKVFTNGSCPIGYVADNEKKFCGMYFEKNVAFIFHCG